VDFGDVADIAVPDHLGALARAFVGVALVAHLRGDAVLAAAARNWRASQTVRTSGFCT
jgi:hypothetical protein